jgi:hypothetical protein
MGMGAKTGQSSKNRFNCVAHPSDMGECDYRCGPGRTAPAIPASVSALAAEVVDEGSQLAAGVKRKVEGLVDQEVVPWTLADHPEVVDEGIGELSVDE